MGSMRGETFRNFNLAGEEAMLLLHGIGSSADEIGDKWDLDLLDKFELDHGIIDSLTSYKLTDEVETPRGMTYSFFVSRYGFKVSDASVNDAGFDLGRMTLFGVGSQRFEGNVVLDAIGTGGKDEFSIVQWFGVG
jgi:hypothetical protein